MANIQLGGSVSTTGTSILGSFNVIFASDADHTLTVTEYTNNFLNVTSGVSLTTTRNLIAPLVAGQGFVIQNNTTGGQSITVMGVTGTGFTIANGTTSGVICDGTNYLQIGGAISGAAGGQLSGNYPNPIVISTTPIYVNGLHAITPLAPHISILVDGYSSNNDGGGGSFFWNINYTGPSNPLNIIPDGYASPGAWSRVIGTDHVIEATWFGAKGDMHRDVSNNLIGTDDTAAIQAMLDFNNFTADADTAGNWTTNQFQYICKLSATNIKYQTFLVQARTCYRITEPLQINDFWASYNGHNTTTSFIGEPLAQSGLYHQEFLGPAIVSGNYGINPPFITLDPNGSGEYLVQFGQGISTTIASGSNGQTLPQSIVYVASTAGFPHAGTFTTGGIQVAYTGITSNTFTGCTIVTAFVVPVPMTTGDAVATASAPTYCFSDYSTGDLQGWTNFTFECFLNPGDSAAWMQSAYPSSFSSSWFGCGGNIGTVKNHRTMHLQQNNIFGFPFLQFNLTTANGTFIVSTSGSVDHTFTPNTLNHFAVTYDGSHLRMFVNGLQPDASMTVAATGALAQQWYESLSVLSGLNESWPFQGGTGIQQPGPAGMLMGKIRFSNIARYTAPFAVPAPSTVVCDTNTRILLGFSPDFVPTRNSLQNYAIAQSGQGLKGKILPDGYGFPVWLRSYCNGLSYVGGTRIKDMFFAGAGEAIRLTTCTDSTVGENCFILGTESGIIFDSFSYNSGVGPNVTFWQCGLPTINANCFSAEIFFGGGSQFSYIGDGMSSGFGSCNWSVVSVFADLKMGTCFPNSYHQGTYAFVQNVSTILMDGTTMLDDTSSGFAMCGCLFAPTSGAGEARLTWHGGYIGMEDSNNVPVFIIGSDSPVNIDTTIFVSTCPVFSFQGAGTTTKTPAILSGSTSAGTAIIDPVFPGPVIVPQLSQYPRFVSQLSSFWLGAPASLPTRAVIQVDGYTTVGDGGEGTFYWNAGYTGPSTPLTVIPTGATVGAWCREIGTDNVITAAMFGAKGDCVEDLTKINGLAGTDDTAALQSMLDYNNLYLQDGYDVRQYVCKLPATQYQFNSRLTAPRTTYRLSSPLQINDYTAQGNGSTVGNTTQQLLGEPGARSGLIAVDYQGPAVVCGNYGAHPPTYIPDPNGSGETLCPIGLSVPTTIAAGSDGQVLPQAIIHVADTSAFPTAGLIYIVASNGFQSAAVNYTGSTSTTFTGCTLVAGYTAITLNTGDRVSAYVFSPPSWNLSEYSLGDLQGWTNFTFECFVNPGNSNAWADTHSPAGFISSFFGCAGTLGGPGGLDTTTAVRYHLTFQLQQYNVFGPQALAFQVQTANGSYTVGTSTSVDHTWTANTLNHFAVSYDGAHLRMFINGAQPDSSMTVAATGALVQQWYESMTLATGGNINFPVFGNGGLFNSAAPGFLLGKTRLSNTARYTAPFTPPLPSAVVCDANTRFYLDFVSSIPSRPGLQCYSIAQSGEGRWGRMLPDGYGFPVWLKTWTNSTQYTSNARVKSLYFQSAGRGIDLESSLNSVVGEDCFFLSCEQGIVFDNFSYNSGVGPNCAHALSGASTSSNCMSAEIIFGPGSQFAYVEDGWSSQTGGANWGLIQVFTDVKIGNTFLTTYVQGTYCFVQNSTTVLLDGSSLQDGGADGGTFDLCGILFAPSDIDAVLTWQGGYGGLSNNVPMIIIGNSGASVTVNTSVFGLTTGPIFSFQGRLAASTTTPAIFPGGNPEGMLVIDPAHPGPVIVPQQQLATTGVNVLTFGADPTGVNDSYNAFVNAIKFASSLSVPLFVPYGTYNISRYIAIENEITIEGAISSNGFSGATQQPTIEGFIYGGNAAQPFWGGTWMGPLFTVVAPGVAADSPVGYTHNHGIYKAQVGGINGVNNYPIMFLSETGCSSLNGLAAMTVEYAFNFHTMDASNATPWCGGAMSDFSPFTTTFQVYTIGGPTNYGLHATLTTTNGVFDCATSPTALTINTDYCAAVTYDGTNLKLFAGPPGGSPIVTATVAADGYVVQNPWEDFIMGASGGGITDSCTWPLGWGNLTDPMEWGNFRLSNIARTITTMPATEFLVGDRDANTLLMISFDPAYRTGLGGIVATTHDPAFCGYILAGPGSCYLQWRNIIATVGQGVRCDFKNLVLSGYEGITTEFANFVNTYNLSFATRKGITRVNNSYYYEDINPKFDTSSFNAGNASHNWGIASLDTAGLGKIEGANFTSQDGSNASLVLNGASNMIIRDFFINTVNGWVGIFASGSGDLLFDNVGMGSENGTPNVIQAMAIFNDNTNVNWNGGGLYPLTDCLRQCNILIDKGAGNVGPAGTGGQYRFNLDLAGHSTYITSHFSCPPGHNPTFPIILESSYQGRGIEGVYPWSDGYANVVVQPLETNGRSVYATTSSAAITCQWMTPQPGTVGSGPDFSCGTLVITDTGNFLTGTTVVNPPPNFAFAGYTRTVVAPSTHAIIFGGVTIQPSQSVTVESNGTSTWSIVNVGTTLQGYPVATGVPVDGYVLTWNGSQWIGESPSVTLSNYLVTQLSTLPGVTNATIIVDGYAATADGGQGLFFWNAAYTGPNSPINIYPNGGSLGAWTRLIETPLVSVLWFGAKGDNVTDDTLAIQSCINALYPAATGTLYFPGVSTTGITHYITTAPLFLGGGGLHVTADANVQISPAATFNGPCMMCLLPFPDPTYGTEDSLTYVHISDAGGNFYNLAYTPMNNVHNWGNGNVCHNTAPYTISAYPTFTSMTVNDTTPLGAVGAASFIYIHNSGLYNVVVVDATHLNTTFFGVVVAADTGTGGGTLASGTPISGFATGEYAGPTAGFTFECFVDPITDSVPGTLNPLATSCGTVSSNPVTSAFQIHLYNDQGTNQTRIKFQLNTSITGITTLLGGSHTLPAGTLTHVACTYDGYQTMSLYVNGVRANTATVTGYIVQEWYELLCLGITNEGYPGAERLESGPEFKIAGIGITPIAKYSGASFTPPTTVPTPISRLASSVIDFAQRPNITGPGGVNYATGWVLCHAPNNQASPNGIDNTWLQIGQGGGLNYCTAPIMTNITIQSTGPHLGDGIYTWSALDGIFDNVYVNSGTRGITLDGFSYRNRLSNTSTEVGFAGLNDVGVNQYTWCLGIIGGSQYAIVDGGYCAGGGWNIISDVYAGINIRNLWLETVGYGGIGLFGGGGAPSATIHDVFFQSDIGETGLNNSLCSMYLSGIANVIVEGGYMAAGFSNASPQLLIDNCTNVVLNGCWMAPNSVSLIDGYYVGTNQALISMKNQILPVYINTTQAFNPYAIPKVYTTYHIINGSANVAASGTSVFAPGGTYGQFDAQPNTTYVIESVDPSTGNLVLNLPYSGPTTTAAGLTTLGYPWMPEDGYSGQGPLYINAQEQFGVWVVNMIATTGMTLLINDFLWGVIEITDTNNLLSGVVKVTLPLINGYRRTFTNKTSQTLNFGGTTGTTFSCASNTSIAAVCDGTNWIGETTVATTANYLVTQLSTLSGVVGATILIDGYSVPNDGGQGFFSWNPTYTGVANPINIYPNGGTTGAWQRLLTSPLLSVLYFGAKGDGSTDDTRAIQACINAIYPSVSLTVYFPGVNKAGTTIYSTSAPLHLGGGGPSGANVEVLMDSNVTVTPTNSWGGPVFTSLWPFPAIVTGVENGLTYTTLDNSSTNIFNMAYTSGNSLYQWGDGYGTFTTASFVTPSLNTNVNVQVDNSAIYTGTIPYIYMQNVGLFQVKAVIDPTHITLESFGPVVAADVMTNVGGQTIGINSILSQQSTSDFTGPTPGFTFECFVDPITDYLPSTSGVLASSAGGVGSINAVGAFNVSLYNDQVTAQTRLQFALCTSVTGLTTIKSGTHTITAGSMTHVAATYDGINTMSLYIAGQRVATATVTGSIVQQWYELIFIGALTGGGYPGLSFLAGVGQSIRLAGIGLAPIAKYSGASFTPPTTVPQYLSRFNCTIIDFAQAPHATGPFNEDYGAGWVLAQVPNATASTLGVPCWLQTSVAGGLNFAQGTNWTNVNITANGHLGDGLYCWSSLNSVIENCYISGPTRGVTLDGFSYRCRLSNMAFTTPFAGNADAGFNQYSWCLGVLQGSQYCNIDGGYYAGGAWNIVNNVYAGIGIKGPMWFETTGLGGILLSSEGGGPAATIRDVFFQSDLGQSGRLGLASIYAANILNLIIEGGYLGASFVNAAPQLVLDSCTTVALNGAWIVAVGMEPIHMINQKLPVSINTNQAGAPFVVPQPTTNFHVTNGSMNVSANNNTYFFATNVNEYIVFTSQPNTTYKCTTSGDPTTGNFTITPAYSGTTTTNAGAQVNGYSWMPEDGYAGQGPLLIASQESFGVNIINMISSSGMTLLVNDFLWGVIRFTDDDSLLSGTVKVTLPLIAGYTRRMINSTTQSLTLGGVTGSTVTLTSNSATTIACDGTNWFLA